MDQNIVVGLLLNALVWASLLCAATGVAVWILKELFPGVTRRPGGRRRSAPRHTDRSGQPPVERKGTERDHKAA